jgi:hypothetical protein
MSGTREESGRDGVDGVRCRSSQGKRLSAAMKAGVGRWLTSIAEISFAAPSTVSASTLN